MNRHAAISLFALLLAASATSKAQVPDLTNGGVPNIRYKTNLGPTGLEGWMYQASENVSNTSQARQILVTAVDPGSPADGILAVDDVILGVDGTGATPTHFTSDPRPALAAAINEAEARSPATLKFLRWHAGVTEVVGITLQTLGAYAPTAPYNCPKSALILENALDYAMQKHPDGGYQQLGALSLLAGNDPSNPKNADRQARAAALAQSLMPTAKEIEIWMNDVVTTGSKDTWRSGYRLMVLSEYYLATNDASVLPGIEALANLVGNAGSIFGAYGHGFSIDSLTKYPGEWGVRGYGAVNSAGLLCSIGMALAKNCGVSTPGLEKALERGALYFSSYINRGGIPYGEMAPIQSIGSNGKSGQAALMLSLLPGYEEEAKYFVKHALLVSPGERDAGHGASFFTRQLNPLAADLAGEAALAANFATFHWILDLERNWEGGFDWNSLYNNGGDHGNNTMAWTPSGTPFYATDYALLTYALPLKQIALTGRTPNPALLTTAAENTELEFLRSYDATTRTRAQLVEDLSIFVPAIRSKVAAEIGSRSADHSYFLPLLTSIASDLGSDRCEGALLALGKIGDPSTIPQLVNLLTNPDTDIAYHAVTALRNCAKADTLPYANAIMDAALANHRPLFPLDPEDPMMEVNSQIASLLFSDASGEPRGIFADSLDGIDRNRLYQIIEIFAELPRGGERRYLRSTFPGLATGDMPFIARPILDVVEERSPVDGMWAHAAQMNALEFLGSLGYAEAAPLGQALTDYYRVSKIGYVPGIIPVLESLAGSSLTVEPDPQMVEFFEDLVFEGIYEANSQAVLDAIAADTNPEVLTPLKGIHSLTADSPVLTLPSDRTVLRADTFNYGADNRFTWRKVHGAGEVILAPLNNPDDGSRTVIFEGVPGEYLFELTISDHRELTIVKETVAVRLEMPGGGLPTNNPPSASPQSLTVSQGKPAAITLSGSDPEGYALDYTVITEPLHGTLSGTAPLVIYQSKPGYTGPDKFDFEVMDSKGQTATATVSLSVDDSNPVGLALYEPFDYTADTGLNGKSGTSEIGFAAPWVATSSALVRSGPLMLIPEETLSMGGHISNSNNISIDRDISASALADNGLLDDGSTLWFGLQLGIDPNENVTNSAFAMALANNRMSTGFYETWIRDEGAVSGSGVGILMMQSSGRLMAAQFLDASFGTGVGSGRIVGEYSDPRFSAGERALIVGKITWGATPDDMDRIELYWPRVPYLIPDEPTSVLEMQVDQSTFDTLTIRTRARVAFDEIRFGQNLSSVLSGTTAMVADLSAPEPNPTAFHLPPTVASLDAITMSAQPVFDVNGVEYYFNCTSGGGNDSGWQSSPDYTDTGLTPGVTYSYTVTTRDLSPAKNTASASLAASATIPTEYVFPDLIGISVASAAHLIAKGGLTLGSITYANDPSVPEGAVIALSESTGSSVPLGGTVDMIISLGPVRIDVPYLTDLDRTQAEAAIAAANLTVGSITYRMSSEAAESVIAQSPAAGSSAVPGTVIDLQISSGESSPGNVVITDSFSFKGDLAMDPAYSTNFGSDGGYSDFYGIDKPLTLSTTGFTAAGADKLVGVISMHNSVANISEVTLVSYGGVDVTADIIVGNPTGSAGYSGRMFFFSVDHPTVDGDLVINFGEQYNVDEVGVALFALDNTEPGYLGVGAASGNPPGISVTAGDFVVGAAQRNNQTINVSNAPPYTQVSLSAGNLTSTLGHRVATADGLTSPTFTNLSVISRVAAFEAIRATLATAVPDLTGLTQAAAESSITAAYLVVGDVSSIYSTSVLAGEVISQNPVAGEAVDAGVSVDFVLSLGSSPTTVPNVVGLAQASAESALASANLVVGIVDTSYSQNIPFGHVVSQNLVAGSSAFVGDVLNLVISLGVDPISDTTPPVLNPADIQDDQGGSDILENTLVTYSVSFSEDMDASTVDATDFSNAGTATITVGAVVETSPGIFSVEVTPTSAGTLQLQINSGAVLTDVSANALDTTAAIADDTVITVNEIATTVPDVLGLTQASAESSITSASLLVGTVSHSYSPTVPAGDVISQNPAAGALVDTGSSVDLVVSYGPQPTVPDVVGLAQSAAQSGITGASLTLGVVTTTFSPIVPAGDVISQSPAAGLSVDTGSSVDLVVSHGPNPAPGTIIDSFSYRFDFAPADVIFGTDGATPPIAIDTTGFTAAGTDKLVIILSVHNSANDIAPITGLTYGGVDVYDNLVAGANLATGSGTKNFIFHLDDPATDGDLLLGFDDMVSPIQDIDEIGVVLFALDGLQPGTAYASESKTAGAFTPANANVGDFVVAVAQRNNQPGTITATNNPPYSEIDITKGELTSRLGYQVASAAGPTAPSFSGFVQYQSFAAFAAAASPSSAYEDWAATNAPTTGNEPAADEDGDGVPNGIEFVVGGTISTNDHDKLPVVSSDDTNMIFSFQRAQQSLSSSVACSIKVGTDLSTWPDDYPVPDAATVGPPVTVEKDTSPGMDTVTLSVPMAPGARKFALLRVEIIP